MSINFPNRSRSYDETEKRVRFLGYDGMFEIKFFVGIDALAKAVARHVSGESEGLAAFDTMRRQILEAAERVYGRGKRGNMIVLTAADFA
jgi:hypothetical protein